MASRALLRSKRFLFNSLNLNRPTCLIGISSSFEHVPPDNFQGLSRMVSHPVAITDSRYEGDRFSFSGDELSNFLPASFLQHYSFGFAKLGSGVGRLDFISFLGIRWFSQSLRYASTAAAGQPEFGSGNDSNKQQAAKQVKEASLEECDEAVEDLSEVKAKAKAKQVQESQKSAQSVLQMVWAMLLGIGPALRVVASMSREDWVKKFHHWREEFKSTMQHYWLGTKLLWANIRISSGLLVKLANGKGLSRRERQQLTHTTADIFRLVPFAVFIIVPFMEFLLPVFLKLFPNMLPSTFQDKMKEQEALKRKLNARIEYAKFLQDTVKEMAKEVQNSQSGEMRKTAEDLDEFMNKVRTGAGVTNEEILGFAKLFNDELTLDNISRPRIVNMCKYMGISPFGTDAYLHFMLRKRLQELGDDGANLCQALKWRMTLAERSELIFHEHYLSLSLDHMKTNRIKNDDKMIQAEGVESLSEDELRQACRDRGLLGLLSVEEMQQQLCDWLDLSLNHSLPSSLLILSRAFSISGKVRPEEAVQATLSSLPDEVVDTVGVTALPSEDLVSERRRKLEFLEMQEELIRQEEEKQEQEQARMKEYLCSQRDVALEEMALQTTRDAHEQAKAKTLEKHEQLCELSRALAVLASASSVIREREEFLRLVKKEIDLYNNMVDKQGTKEEEEAKKAYRAAREESDHAAETAVADKVSSALIERVDAMLQKLEREIDDVDAKIGDRWHLLDRDCDGKVTPEEVASAAMYLKDHLGKEGIQELIGNLSKDREGKILVEDIAKLGSQMEEADDAVGKAKS